MKTELNKDCTMVLHSDVAEQGDVKEVTVSQEEIQRKIYTIRGVQVMLDRDLALLYQVTTGRLNEAVKRNTNRFPEDFMFQLTDAETEYWKSQIAITNSVKMGLRHNPFAFTEEGVSQLAGVLRSRIAVEMSIRITRVFVFMRKFIIGNAGLFQRIDAIERHLSDTDNKVELALKRMDELAPPPSAEALFATGCVWDAYTYMAELIRSAREQVVLVDNYCDDRTLTLLDQRSSGVKCTIHTTFSKIIEDALEKHNRQYALISKIQLPHKIHDRFLIIDSKVYLLGTSLKDMGHTLSAVILTGFTPLEILEKLK